MENKALIIALFLLFAGGGVAKAPASHIIIYELSPYSYPGTNMDYVCIYNPTDNPVALDGVRITDFEGNVYLNGSIAPHSKIYIAENQSSFRNFFGFPPNYTFASLSHSGTFALANHGDELAIMQGTKILDLVVYGNSKYSGEGWLGPPVAIREGHILRRVGEDTDRASDWSTYHRIGQSDFHNIVVHADVELLTLPDDRDEILRFIREAKRSLSIEMYTISDERVVNELVEKRRNGVNISILVEGAPVGGMKNRERFALHRLRDAGITVKIMVSDFGAHSRYSFLHAKFMVADSKKALVMTENMDSLSPCGNRGFGVIIRNQRIAEYLENVYRDDSKNVQDIRSYDNLMFHTPPSENMELRKNVFEPLNITADISFVLSPDFSVDAFKNFAVNQKSLDVEAMYLRDDALKEVYPRVSRILVQYPVNGYSMKEFNGKPMHVRMLHGKLMIGTNAVLLGSMNFGNYAMTQNREVSVVIHSPTAVEYYENVFNHDWNVHPGPEANMHVSIKGSVIKIDLSKSRGAVNKYEVYIDGKLVYSGKNGRITLRLSPGAHTVMGKVVSENGEDSAYRKINIENRSFDFRLILFFVIFAAFFHKLWKNHG